MAAGLIPKALGERSKPMMQIKEIMTRELVVIRPDMVLREAAETMRDLDSGVCRRPERPPGRDADRS